MYGGVRWQMLFRMGDRGSWLGDGAPRRRLRGATRVMQRLLGLDERPVDVAELTDELHCWVLGLPFVEELGPVRSAPHLRRFAVSCPPLNSYSVWLLTGGFEPEPPERGVDIYAVLPQSTALLAASQGWAMLGPDIHGVRRLVAMERPASPGELLGLEDVLIGAYSFAFPD